MGDLERAVDAASKTAVPGDVVLLAPACASFDQYKNFEERGEHFKSLVQRLPEGERRDGRLRRIGPRVRRPTGAAHPARRAGDAQEASGGAKRLKYPETAAAARLPSDLGYHGHPACRRALHDSVGVDGHDEWRQVRLPEESGHHGSSRRVCASAAVSRRLQRLRSWSVAFLGVVVFSLLLVHVPGVARVREGRRVRSRRDRSPISRRSSPSLRSSCWGRIVLTSRRVADGRFWSLHVAVRPGSLVMCVLVYWRADLGTAIIIAGPDAGDAVARRHEGQALGAASPAGLGGAAGLTLMSSERMSRVLSFLNPSNDPAGIELPADAIAGRAGPGRLVRGGPGAERAEVPVPPQGAHRHDLRHPRRGVRAAGGGSGHPSVRAFRRRVLAACPPLRGSHGKTPDRRVWHAGHSCRRSSTSEGSSGRCL